MSKRLFNNSDITQKRNRFAHVFPQHDYIFSYSARDIISNLQGIKVPIQNVLIIGGRTCGIDDFLKQKYPDCSITYIYLNQDDNFTPEIKGNYDAIISNLYLHTINNVQDTFEKIYSLLQPNGFFLFSVFGEKTLSDLRTVMIENDISFFNGATPHIAPFTDIITLGNITRSVGFQAIVIDENILYIKHSSLHELLFDLRRMGERGILNIKPTLGYNKSYYQHLEETYMNHTKPQKNILVSEFNIISAIGWKE